MATMRQLDPLRLGLHLGHALLKATGAQAVPRATDYEQGLVEASHQAKPAGSVCGPIERGPRSTGMGGPRHVTYQPRVSATLRRVVKVARLDLPRDAVWACAAPQAPQPRTAPLATTVTGFGIARDHRQTLHPVRRTPQELQGPEAAQRKPCQEEAFRQQAQGLLRPLIQIVQAVVVQHDHLPTSAQRHHLSPEQACIAKRTGYQHEAIALHGPVGLVIPRRVHTRARRAGRSGERAGWPVRRGPRSSPYGTAASSTHPPGRWPHRSVPADRCRS